jgi:DNA-binding Lrp family transcriptional regulator
MTSAFVLVNCRFPFDNRITEQISAMQHVVGVYRTEGRYDLIVKVTAETEEKLREMIATRLDKINGIDATISLIAKEQFDKLVVS